MSCIRAMSGFVAVLVLFFGFAGTLPFSYAQSTGDDLARLKADLAKRKSNLEKAEKLRALLDAQQKALEEAQKYSEEQQRQLPIYYLFNNTEWLNGKTAYELLTEYFKQQGAADFLVVDKDDLNSSLMIDPQNNSHLSLYRNVKISREICLINISYNYQRGGTDLVSMNCPESKVSIRIVNEGGYRSGDGHVSYLGPVVEPVLEPSPWYKFW